MELSMWTPGRRGVRPPPLWLVSDGSYTVGPVNTTRLVRGVVRGKVEDDWWVRDQGGVRWRSVAEVREVRALHGKPEHSLATLEVLLRLTDDVQEAMRLGLEIAMRRTGAAAGLAHAFEDPMRAPVTRAVFGLGRKEQEGAPLPENDALARVARARCIALGEPRSDRAFAAAALRLGSAHHDLRGIAMIPIAFPRGVVGMLELARSQHPFRASDAVVLREVARAITH